MKNYTSKLVITLSLALLATLAPEKLRGADIYIAPSAAGADNGTSAANAHSAAWLNNAANWIPGAGRVSPGDTIHLCGTFTSPVTALASGTSGNPITLLFEPNAKLSSPVFPTTGAINLNQLSNLIVDGGTNGVIENTNNGSALGNRLKSVGVFAAASHYTTIRNLTIRNLYVHTDRTDSTDLDNPEGGIYCGNQNYLTISNCTMSDIHWAINFQFGGATLGLNITRNHIYNVDHGIAVGVSGKTAANISITDNYIHDYAKWDTDSNRYHHDGIHFYTLTGARVTNLLIARNLFGGDLGGNNTAHIYLESEVAGSEITNALVCNNVFLPSTIPRACFGVITVGGGGTFTGRIANNTIFGVNSTGFNAMMLSGGNPTIINNIVSGAWVGVAFYKATPGARFDYNTWANLGGNGICNGYRTISSWQAYLGSPNELHSSVVANPLLNSDGSPLTNSPLIGAGSNLSAFFTTDYRGNARPASGAWDSGAYQYRTSSVSAWLPPVVSTITQSSLDVNPAKAGIQVFAGSVIQYSGTASDPGNHPVSWRWLYSTNGAAAIVAASGTGAVGSLSYNYAANAAGLTYLWKLGVSNAQAYAESSLQVEIEAPPPPSAGLTFAAGAGVITAPFTLTNGYISQAQQTVDPNLGGRAAYSFYITNAGNYVIQCLVRAPSDGANSCFLNIDAEPSSPGMVWDIPTTSNFEQRVTSWRGTGTDVNNQYVPMVFTLSKGNHQIIIRGREANVQIQSLMIVQLPPTPRRLRSVPKL